MQRWRHLTHELAQVGVTGVVSAEQVHGTVLAETGQQLSGWLRLDGIDGHLTSVPGVALAVTVADCTPVFIASESGWVALLHAGWRGAAAGIMEKGFDRLRSIGVHPSDCSVHLGAAICGACYEVGEEVLREFGKVPVNNAADGRGVLDVRQELAERATACGVRRLTISTSCTRCNNDLFFSHRAGDEGRQLGIIARLPGVNAD